MPIEPSRQAEQAVGIRRRSANLDRHTLAIEQIEVETLATEIQPGVQHCVGASLRLSVTRGASLRRKPFMAFLTMRSKRQPVAAGGHSLTLDQAFSCFWRPERLPRVAIPLFHNCSIPIGQKRALWPGNTDRGREADHFRMKKGAGVCGHRWKAAVRPLLLGWRAPRTHTRESGLPCQALTARPSVRQYGPLVQPQLTRVASSRCDTDG